MKIFWNKSYIIKLQNHCLFSKSTFLNNYRWAMYFSEGQYTYFTVYTPLTILPVKLWRRCEI